MRLSALKRTIEAARLEREIVVSNYPSYREAGSALARSYEQLEVTNKQLVRSLKRFSYTFDDVDLVECDQAQLRVAARRRQERQPSHPIPAAGDVRRPGERVGGGGAVDDVAASASVGARSMVEWLEVATGDSLRARSSSSAFVALSLGDRACGRQRFRRANCGSNTTIWPGSFSRSSA